MIIAAVYLATFWTVRTAQAALPGDAVYPLKQWMREQRLSLTPPDQRIQVIADNEKELAQEAEKLATVQQTNPEARAMLALENTEPMVYHGRKGNLLMIGPFLVAPNYQPNAAAEDFAPMDIQGSLQPGAVVQLTYRVLPGNPNVVQGVRAVVVDGPKPAPTPTAAPLRAPSCQISLPGSWVPYVVRPGDTMDRLAHRSGASILAIMDVNCLETASLTGVSQVYLPERVYVQVTPTTMPPTALPPPPTITPVPTATDLPQPTATPMPPTTMPTEMPAGTPTEIATGEATPLPTGEATAPATPESTSEPGTTPAATATAITGTPAATATGTSGQIPGQTPTVLPTGTPNCIADCGPNRLCDHRAHRHRHSAIYTIGDKRAWHNHSTNRTGYASADVYAGGRHYHCRHPSGDTGCHGGAYECRNDSSGRRSDGSTALACLPVHLHRSRQQRRRSATQRRQQRRQQRRRSRHPQRRRPHRHPRRRRRRRQHSRHPRHRRRLPNPRQRRSKWSRRLSYPCRSHRPPSLPPHRRRQTRAEPNQTNTGSAAAYIPGTSER